MLLEILKKNKGTVSSKLGKELALEVLNGDENLLKEATELVTYELNNIKSKSIRAGAAKIIEKVSEKRPDLVAPYLSDILIALEAAEPQTRWMIIMSFGYCASKNIEVAEKGIKYAENYINEQNGVCLSGAAEIYLGYMGKVSKKYAKKVFPILIDAMESALPNEIDWIFEALIMISKHLDNEQKAEVFKLVSSFEHLSKKSTEKRKNKLLKLTEGY